MSNVPAKARTTPPQRSWPPAVSTAATKVSAVPSTVIWFGVTGRRPSAAIRDSACRRTQASNRVVNIQHLSRTDHLSLRAYLASLAIDLEHLRSDLFPCVAAGLLEPVCAHPVPKLGVARKDDQRRTELRPALWLHGQAVTPGLEHRHVAVDLRSDDRQPGRHGFEEHDPEALRAGRGRAEDVGAAVIARKHGVRDVARHHDVGHTMPGDVRLDAAPQRSVA